MESNKVKGLIFPVGGEAQAFLADRDRPYRDIREAVQGEYDELGATFADVDIYVNAAGADSLLPNRAINPDSFMDDSASYLKRASSSEQTTVSPSLSFSAISSPSHATRPVSLSTCLPISRRS